MAAIEVSFVVSREEGGDTTFAVVWRRQISGYLWEQSVSFYEGQHTTSAVNMLSKVIQEATREVSEP